MVRLTLFGGLTLEIDGRAPTGRVAQRKRLAVLAVLGVTPLGVSRDKLVALLWPEADAATARHQLATALYDVRRALGENAVVTSGDSVRLDATLVACDTRRFDELLGAGDREPAVSLYRGPLLDGFHLSDAPEFERWLATEQSRYARRYSTAVETLARAATGRGDHAKAADLWRRLAAVDPLSSRIATELVRALAAAGDRAAAIQHAHRHSALIRADLNVEPDDRFIALVEDVQRVQREIPRTETQEPSFDSGEANAAAPVSPTATRDPVPSTAADAPPRRGSRERRRAGVVFGLVGVVVAATLIMARASGRSPYPWRDHPLVVVAPLENRTGDSTLDLVGVTASDWIRHGLAGIGVVEVVDATIALQSARKASADPTLTGTEARLRAIANGAGASVIVGGSFYRQGDSLTFHVSVVEATSGTVLRSVPVVVASANDPMPGIDRLRERTVGALATLFDERLVVSTTHSSPVPTVSAYLEYARGLDAAASREPHGGIAHFERARGMDSTFVLPLIALRFAYANRGDTLKMYPLDSLLGRMRDRLSPLDRYAADYMMAFQRANWEACYRAVRNAAALAPQSQWPDMVAYVALARFLRPREAAEALEKVDPDYGAPRTMSTFWYRLSLARHLMGDQQRALAAARTGRERFPFDREILSQEVAALAALGDVNAVRRRLEELQRLAAPEPGPYWSPTDTYYTVNAGLELLAHGQPAAGRMVLESAIAWSHAHQPRDSLRAGVDRTTRGIALYCLHRWSEAQATFDTLLATRAVDWEWSHWRDPRYWLASLAARRGDRATAERWASQVELPYARARVAAIFGERERAVSLLRSSIADGRDTHVPIDYDCDFDSLREYRPFRELLNPSGTGRRFIAALGHP